MRLFYVLIGLLLIIASIAGILISVFGIAGVWQARQTATDYLVATFDVLDSTLAATSDALDIASTSMNQATLSVETLAETLQTTGKSVNDSLPLIDTLTQMSAEDLPKSITAAQKALAGAGESAEVIDSTLALLTSIPLLPVEPYDPEVPLSQALGEVSETLAPLAESFSSMEESLTDTKGNLSEIEGQLTAISTNVTTIQTSLAEADSVIAQYKESNQVLRDQIGRLKSGLAASMEMLAWGLTVVLAWLGLTQVGLLMQGFEMLGLEFRSRARKSTAAA